MRIFVDIPNAGLCTEILDVLVRAGHTIERGVLGAASVFELALVGTPEAAERLRRARPAAAIIVVTRIGDVPARVRALEAGADDAFDGSFPPSQIAARVGAVGRRAAMTPPPIDRVVTDGCVIDLFRRRGDTRRRERGADAARGRDRALARVACGARRDAR